MVGAHPAFTIVLALAVGIVAQSMARHIRTPGIVVLLVAGAALGPDGLGWVQPDALGEGLISIVHLAVAVILFEGGLNLDISRLRREQAAIRRLVTLGAALTLVGGALTVHAFYGGSFMRALLFGSLVVVTGPTVVGPLVRELRLRPRVATVLEAEGVLIDPVGAILAVLMLEIALAPGAGSIAGGTGQLLLRLAFGAGAGAVAGFALAFSLRTRRLVPEGHENIFVLAVVLLLFQGCEEIVSESGIVAVTMAGVVVGNQRTRVDRDLREFKDQLTVMMIGMLFVLLAADVRLETVRALGWRGVGVLAVLVFAVRPVVVWVCTLGTELTRAERWFVASVAPRGIVAAAVASVTAGALDSAGIEGGSELRALVFLTIAGTVVQAGLMAGPIANLLGVRLPGRDTVAILGAHGLGLHLATALRAAGLPTVFIDSNPQNCRQAEEAGFTVVFGDALQERTLQRARFEGVGAAVGLTSNQMLNSVFASRAGERFNVPEAYIAVSQAKRGLAPELVENEKARMLFEGPVDVERWDVRTRHSAVEVERWQVAEPVVPSGDPIDPADHLVLLCVQRGKRTFPMYADLALAADDVLSVAVHVPDRDAAHETLRTLGYTPEPAPDAPKP